jgi:hypothetical protein
MPPGDIAPLIIATMSVGMGGLVLILRPISKRIGALLEAFAEEKRRGAMAQPPVFDKHDLERLISAMETLDRRLNRIEERQDFTDQLLNGRTPSEARVLHG